MLANDATIQVATAATWLPPQAQWAIGLAIAAISWIAARMYERTSRWDEHIRHSLAAAYSSAYSYWTAYDGQGMVRAGIDAPERLETWRSDYATAMMMAKRDRTQRVLTEMLDTLKELPQVAVALRGSTPAVIEERVFDIDHRVQILFVELKYWSNIELRRGTTIGRRHRRRRDLHELAYPASARRGS